MEVAAVGGGVPRERKRGGEVERKEKRSPKHRKGTKGQKKKKRGRESSRLAERLVVRWEKKKKERETWDAFLPSRYRHFQ